MQAKIFSFVKMSEDSMVASVQIARFVSGELGVPVCDDGSVAADGPLEVLLIVNGAFAFCKHLEPLAAAIVAAQRVVWIENDYTIGVPKADSGAESPFRKAFRIRRDEGKSPTDQWTTVEKHSKATPTSHYVNWNTLTMVDWDEEAIARRRVEAGAYLLYYGSFRDGRAEAFERFFRSTKVDTVISSPSSKFKKGYVRKGQTMPGFDVVHEKKFEDLHERVSRAGLGLCLEDKRSHREFHSPPNRFYEMLSAGLPMMIDRDMAPSLRRAGYEVPWEWQVRRAEDVVTPMSKREEVGNEQRVRWLAKAREERAETTRRLHAAWAMLQDRMD